MVHEFKDEQWYRLENQSRIAYLRPLSVIVFKEGIEWYCRDVIYFGGKIETFVTVYICIDCQAEKVNFTDVLNYIMNETKLIKYEK